MYYSRILLRKKVFIFVGSLVTGNSRVNSNDDMNLFGTLCILLVE